MKRHRLLFTTLFLFVFTGIIFGQAQRSANLNGKSIKVQKEQKELKKIEINDISPTAHSFSLQTEATKAAWDILYSFNSHAGSEQAVETDGSYIYTTKWNGTGIFYKYTMTGTLTADSVTITGASAIRDLAFDGTFFYGSNASMNLYKLNLTTGTLVSTIACTCTGVTGIRHCTYDPTLDGGNGGFWIGNWTELGAVTMTGAQIHANVAGNTDCYGSALDAWTDPANPRLLLFQQINSGVEIHAFDINTSTFSGLVHDAADIPGFIAGSIGGGLASYTAGGKLILLGNIQQAPNLIFAYELANTASVDAPGAPTALVATPGASGAMTVSATWTNPAVTVSGAVLTELTSVSLYIDAVVTPLYTNSSPVIGGNESQSAINLTAYTPGFHTFKVVGTNTAGDGLPASVTEWIGGDVPAAPGAVTLTNPSGMNASLSWTAPTAGLHAGYFSGTGVTYDVIRMPGNVLVSNDQTGLTFAETIVNPGNYYYTVIASNAIGVGGEANSNIVLFGDFLIFEDFEGLFPNTGWSTVPNTAEWAQATGTVHPSGNPAHSPDKLAFFNSWTVDVGSASLITPSVDLSGIVGQLDFWMFHDPGYPAANDNIQLKMSTNGGTSWTNVGTPLSRYSATIGWVKHTFIITGGTATTSFDFFATSAYGNDIHIDDITLIEAPSCLPPFGFTATGMTLTGATLGWTQGGTETLWNIELGLAGFTPTGTPTATGTTNPYVASGLTSATSYDFYVQADCGGSDLSSWAGPYTFTTLCSAISTFPWVESFEGATFPPICWTVQSPDLGTGWASIASGTTPLPGWTGGTMTTPASGGTYAAYCTYSTGGASSNDQWLISPPIAVQTNHELKFQVFWFGSYVDLLEVKISTTTNDMASFTTTLLAIDTLDLVQSDWTSFTIDIASYAGQNVYFAFNEHVADNVNDGAFLGLDLVSVDVATGIKPITQDVISVYPNPTTGMVYVTETVESIEVTDILGQVLVSKKNAENIDLSGFKKGIYFVKVTNNNQTKLHKITLVK